MLLDFNYLIPWGCGDDFKSAIAEHILRIEFVRIGY